MKRQYVATLDDVGHGRGVRCEDCGGKAEDCWDPSPEGFYTDGESGCCLCEDCFDKAVKETMP